MSRWSELLYKAGISPWRPWTLLKRTLYLTGDIFTVGATTVDYFLPSSDKLIRFIVTIFGVFVRWVSAFITDEEDQHKLELLKQSKNFVLDVYKDTRPNGIRPGDTRGMDLTNIADEEENAYENAYGVTVAESLDFRLDARAVRLRNALTSVEGISTYVDEMLLIWTKCLRLDPESIDAVNGAKFRLVDEIRKLM